MAGAKARAAVAYAPGQKVIPQSWAVAQVEGSLDYAHDAPLTTWWCGALNYQIEHHLFPGISQYHCERAARRASEAACPRAPPHRALSVPSLSLPPFLSLSRAPPPDPAIAPMVKAICKKHGVRYNYEPTFVAAWTKHVHMLYEMGQKGFKYHWD